MISDVLATALDDLDDYCFGDYGYSDADRSAILAVGAVLAALQTAFDADQPALPAARAALAAAQAELMGAGHR